MEQNTMDIINSLDISNSQKNLLLETIEWEKELSWSVGWENGYDAAGGQMSAGVLSPIKVTSDNTPKADKDLPSFGIA